MQVLNSAADETLQKLQKAHWLLNYRLHRLYEVHFMKYLYFASVAQLKREKEREHHFNTKQQSKWTIEPNKWNIFHHNEGNKSV